MGGRPYALPFFTLAWVVVMGIVGVGRQRRGKPRLYLGIAGICLGLGLMAEISCGGVGGGGSTPPPVVTVTVSPGSATLFANEAGNSWPTAVTQQQFTATVNNSTNQNVTWAVTGGSANGTVDGTGLYTAPAVAAEPGDGDGNGHVGGSDFAGIGCGNGAASDRGGDIADYGDGYGCRWGAAKG